MLMGLAAGCGGGALNSHQGQVAPSNLSYPATKISATVGPAIPPDVPTVSGSVDSYSISPALPAGLTLSASTGAIAGTPTAVSPLTSYTVTAKNSAGSTTANLQISVSIAAPSNLLYPATDISATVGTAITPDVPTISGTVDSYSINPTLPAGLTLSASTGAIAGTPTAVSAPASYTVTAENSAGSTTADLQISVSITAPSNLAYPRTTISATAGTAIIPDVPTVSGSVDSYSISPALPAGLQLNTSMGAISGTPTAVTAQANYTVTAQNSGGSTTAIVTISVAPLALVDLGHANTVGAIRMVADRVLSGDISGHWVLWSYSGGTMLASGQGSSFYYVSNNYSPIKQLDMAGTVFVIATPNGLEIRSTSDGQLLSIVYYSGVAQPSGPWWQLASDGSYVAIGSETGIAAYSTAGNLIWSKPGDYSSAKAYSASGEVLVALGPAGQSVVESISIPGGTSTVSPSFSGTFNSWFLDGSRFLTNEQNYVWVYSSAAVQQAVVGLPTLENLTGQGNWIWTYAAYTPGYPLEVYAIGSPTPSLSYAGNVDDVAVGSGNTIGLLSYGAGQLTVIDLSGSQPSSANYSVPVAYLGAYAANSSANWVVGNVHGALFDGASLASTPRYFGYGQAWSIAGSSASVAVSTAFGKIFVFDPSVPELQQTLGFSSSKVSLSADGTVLGAMANDNDSQYEPDRTLNFYSLPSGNVIQSYPYTYNDPQPDLFDFTLSGSGTTIAQLSGTWDGSKWTYTRKVTPLSGTPVIWSDMTINAGPNPPTTLAPILLSPDGTLIDVYADVSDTCGYSTNIFKNGQLVTSIAGVPLGWLDNQRILVNEYVNKNVPPYAPPVCQYSEAVIYDSTGTRIATPALPELKSIQPVAIDLVYDPSQNTIYSLTTGKPTWTGSLPSAGLGAVTATHVVYQSGSKIVAETF